MNSSSEVIRIATANLLNGGIEAGGGNTRWVRSVGALKEWAPHVVCVQEMATGRDPRRLRAHLWATASTLGMDPVLGSEGGTSGNYPAILVDQRRAAIIDTGPLPRQLGHDPSWCEVLLQVPSGPQLRVYSAHLPPGAAAEQAIHAGRLATTIAQRGEPAVVMGDWNCFARADQLGPEALAAMPAHLRPARMRVTPDRGGLVANYDVDDLLSSVGLVDVAAGAEGSGITPTSLSGGGRPDRCYVTCEVWQSGAVRRWELKDGRGSDHLFGLAEIGLAELATVRAPGFQV